MKRFLLPITILAIVLMSCNKEQFHSRRLYIGDGNWEISGIRYQTFNSSGTVIKDSTVTGLGELVFYKSGSFNALYEYRLAVWLHTDSLGTHGYPFEYVFDGERINIRGLNNPLVINGVYASEENKKRKQVWVITTTKSNGLSNTTLGSKTTLTLNKK